MKQKIRITLETVRRCVGRVFTFFAMLFLLGWCRAGSCIYFLYRARNLDDIIISSLLCRGILHTEIINKTRSIQWSRVAADIQVMMNHTMVQTGAFVSEKIWGSDLFQATIISALFLIAYWSIIYLDSSQPGVNPPSPLASIVRKK